MTDELQSASRTAAGAQSHIPELPPKRGQASSGLESGPAENLASHAEQPWATWPPMPTPTSRVAGESGPMKRIIAHPKLREIVEAMRQVGVRLPPTSAVAWNPVPDPTITAGVKIGSLGSLKPVNLEPGRGKALIDSGVPLFAYDESIAKYAVLEGTAQFTAHALVTAFDSQYLPLVFVTSYFYTRSRQISKAHPALQYTDDAEISSQKDYIRDRIALLRENIPDGAVLIIDGPLIAGDVYTTFLPFLEELHKRNVIPIFVVKNSESSLVLEAVPEWRELYNSDLHWAHRTLDVGQRSALFKYQDITNPRNSKVFAYVRVMENSPLRVELHLPTFEKHRDKIDALFDLCGYMILTQGQPQNPQPRLVAIAEMFAREAVKLLDVQALMRRANLVPTVNQVRFGGA